MQNDSPKENRKIDDWEVEPLGWTGWIIFICFGIPWILGIGAVGIFLLEVID